MEHDKLIRTVKELRQESLAQGYPLTYTVISGSMRCLISPGDVITIQKVPGTEIRRGDIIAWNRSETSKEYPVVHRVIEQKKIDGVCWYRTKGDYNPFPDDEWITPDKVLGRVTAVRKKTFNIQIDIDTMSGRFIDLVVRGITGFVMTFKRLSARDARRQARRAEKTRDLKRFSWDIGYYCNFKCFYCFTFGAEWDRLNKVQGAARPPEEIERAWAAIHRSYGPCLLLVTGGEPLEYPRFAEIANRVSRYHFMQVTSNLSQPVDPLIDALDPERVTFNATFHPQYMDFKTFLDRVLRLRGAGFTCEVCYLAHPSQLREMLEYRKRFLRKKISMTITEFRGTFRGKEYPREYSADERAFVRHAQRCDSDVPDTVPGTFEDHDVVIENSVPAVRENPCLAGSRYAVVSVDGNVRPCGQVSGPVLGNIFSGNVSLRDGPFPCPVGSCPGGESAYCRPDNVSTG